MSVMEKSSLCLALCSLTSLDSFGRVSTRALRGPRTFFSGTASGALAGRLAAFVAVFCRDFKWGSPLRAAQQLPPLA